MQRPGQHETTRSVLWQRRPRQPLSCESCRRSKLRCDRQKPCGNCSRRAIESSCAYKNVSRQPTSQRLPQSPSLSPPSVPTTHLHSVLGSAARPSLSGAAHSATDNIGGSSHYWDAVFQRPIYGTADPEVVPTLPCLSLTRGTANITELLAKLPPTPSCDFLVYRFFMHVSPLYPILHGQTFQRQYAAFLQEPDKVNLSWLGLLFMVCSLGLLTLDPDESSIDELWPSQDHIRDVNELSSRLRNAAMWSLSQDNFMVCQSLDTLEALLVFIYALSHIEGVERGWALLGMALNIGIALKCHVDEDEIDQTEKERRRRLWAGILVLHTYQAILFRDIDLSSLVNIKATLTTELQDPQNHGDTVQTMLEDFIPSSVMTYKLRLFQLSSQICSHLSGPSQYDVETVEQLDTAIGAEQKKWDAIYLIDGVPSILDVGSYAHWCVLQIYAHQLYLLLHRPFHHSTSAHFRPHSRARCIESSIAILDLHRQFCELPRLRCYRWLVNGMTSSNALHGAVALCSCLLDSSDDPNCDKYMAQISAAVTRIGVLRKSSPTCAKAYPILRRLYELGTRQQGQIISGVTISNNVADWIDNMDWFGSDSVVWDSWEQFLAVP